MLLTKNGYLLFNGVFVCPSLWLYIDLCICLKLYFAFFSKILIGTGFSWVSSTNGEIPNGAVLAGQSMGEPLYIGRAPFSGALLPGKINPNHRCLYITHMGYEHNITNYETLIEPPQQQQQKGLVGRSKFLTHIQQGSLGKSKFLTNTYAYSRLMDSSLFLLIIF